MGRIPRKNPSGGLSKAQIEDLRLKDYMGQVSDKEIQVAKQQGLLKWDLWRKVALLKIFKGEHHRAGLLAAPVFGKDGKPEKPGAKYLVSNYDDLRQYSSN